MRVDSRCTGAQKRFLEQVIENIIDDSWSEMSTSRFTLSHQLVGFIVLVLFEIMLGVYFFLDETHFDCFYHNGVVCLSVCLSDYMRCGVYRSRRGICGRRLNGTIFNPT